MKKLTKIIACIVLAFISIIGLSACTLEECKQNMSTKVENTTNVVTAEYAQDIAKNLYTQVISNTLKKSYSMICETTEYEENYITNVNRDIVNTYNKNDSTIMVVDYAYENVKGTNVSYYGKSMVAKLKDTTSGEEEYYSILDLYSNEEHPDILKVYSEGKKAWVSENSVMSVYAFLLYPNEYVTSAVSFSDGFTYISLDYANGDIYITGTFKIKDGLLYEVNGYSGHITTLDIVMSVKAVISYNNLPAMPNLPETIQELDANGYIKGSAGSIINSKIQ